MFLYLLPGSEAVRKSGEPWLVRRLKAAYQRVLAQVLDRPARVAVPTIVLLVGALLATSTMGRSFLPEFNEGALVVGVVTLPGTSLAQSDVLARLVEETLMGHPKIAAVGRRTGRAEQGEHVQDVEASEIDLTLDMDASRRLGKPRRTKAELLEALRRDLATIPGIRFTFGQPIGHRIDHMLSGTRASMAVKIFGEDLVKLRESGAPVERIMREIPGVVDLSTSSRPTLSCSSRSLTGGRSLATA